MPFAIVSLLIILVCLGIAAYIIVRKFPKLAALNVEELPEEKEGKKKEEILMRRAHTRVSAFVQKLKERSKALPLRAWGVRAVEHTKRGVGFLEQQYTKVMAERQKKRLRQLAEGEASEMVEARLRAAERLAEEERYEEAEQVYIDVVRMDNKHAGAYRGLGKVYMKNGQHTEAEETFKFLLKLTPDDDTIYVKLGQNSEKAGDREKAIGYYEKGVAANGQVPLRHFELAELYRENGQHAEALGEYKKAVGLEANNPRYLDGLLDFTIVLGKVKEAKELLREFKEVNPENQKLEGFEERIREIK
ncbi:MAG: tetratricopeptide repeat protein [Candidatus Magasanikbacteria bacterium]|nr:tetratricopeptide repeat protein [Candidatus Magasanikbacteria bacterium]